MICTIRARSQHLAQITEEREKGKLSELSKSTAALHETKLGSAHFLSTFLDLGAF